jgi:uncharacterized membrane protein
MTNDKPTTNDLSLTTNDVPLNGTVRIHHDHQPLRSKNRVSGQARATRSTDPLSDSAIHIGRGIRLSSLVDKKSLLATAAYFNLLLAAISTVPVVATGLAAWHWALDGQKLKGILLMHLLAASLSSILIVLVFWIHRRSRRSPEQALPLYRLPIEAFAVLVIGLTAHLGGFLSGVNAPS